MSDSDKQPVVIVTGAGGDIGSALTEGLADRYMVVGLDLKVEKETDTFFQADLTDGDSLTNALRRIASRHGSRFASVIHLAAYFDFSGEDHPLYEKLNVEGTRQLLKALQRYDVEQFVYSGTMLVHQPAAPGGRIDETTPLGPKWVYPQSKAAAEVAIRDAHGEIPYVLLHLAGLYDERSAVPTLSHQIARIYERNVKSHLYSGDMNAGQAVVHREDMIDAFVRAVDRRRKLPPDATILIGEADVMSYRELQDGIAWYVHGEEGWETVTVPGTIAKAAAALEEKSEPVVPDAIDRGEPPFIRPFMIELSSDHYALDIAKAAELLGWAPRHSIREVLPRIVQALKDDPVGWYRANGITPPQWMQAAADDARDPHALRVVHDKNYREKHHAHIWAHWANFALGGWLITAPPALGYESSALVWSDVLSGIAVCALALLSLSPRLGMARWATAAVGLWVMMAPLVFWAPTAAAYLNDTLVGTLIFSFAVLTRPHPGIAAVAAEGGPAVPLGWEYSPSTWSQRAPIILLACVGFFVSRYLTAYQLGHIDAVWDPFFAGGPDPKNGTEEIITSWVSESFPVPDAGLGAMTYLLEILTGVMGSARRWRTMPWLVVLFGIMIVPLGITSVTFIIIQPIVLGTWCALCLVQATAMLIQVPYSVDELVATGQFLIRRKKVGRSLLRVFFLGDTDEFGPHDHDEKHEFHRPAGVVLKDFVNGSVTVPWNLGLCVLIGVWLMFTRLSLGAEAGMANADHLIGALVLAVTVPAFAEMARAVRLLNIPLGAALFVTPFLYDGSAVQLLMSILCGIALILLSIRRGPVTNSYGTWDRYVF